MFSTFLTKISSEIWTHIHLCLMIPSCSAAAINTHCWKAGRSEEWISRNDCFFRAGQRARLPQEEGLEEWGHQQAPGWGRRRAEVWVLPVGRAPHDPHLWNSAADCRGQGAEVIYFCPICRYKCKDLGLPRVNVSKGVTYLIEGKNRKHKS